MDLTKPLKVTNLAKKHKRNATWSQEARIQAVSQYLVLGNMALVSATTGIPHQLLRAWKQQPWWTEMVNQIRATENLQTDTKLTKIVDRSLDAVLDRVENGDFVYNQKTGQIVRKPVNMKDAAKVSVDLLSKRELLRGNPTERQETVIPIADQLKALALEFAKWNNTPPKQETIDVESVEVIDNEIVQEVPDSETIDGIQSEECDGEEAESSAEVQDMFSPGYVGMVPKE